MCCHVVLLTTSASKARNLVDLPMCSNNYVWECHRTTSTRTSARLMGWMVSTCFFWGLRCAARAGISVAPSVSVKLLSQRLAARGRTLLFLLSFPSPCKSSTSNFAASQLRHHSLFLTPFGAVQSFPAPIFPCARDEVSSPSPFVRPLFRHPRPPNRW